MMLGLVDDVALDPLNLTWADGLSPISLCPENIHLHDLAQAGEGRKGCRRTVGFEVSHNVADSLRWPYSQGARARDPQPPSPQ